MQELGAKVVLLEGKVRFLEENGETQRPTPSLPPPPTHPRRRRRRRDCPRPPSKPHLRRPLKPELWALSRPNRNQALAAVHGVLVG